jgi:D-sedoheptulose 7-phosphate isomerase
MFNFKNYIKGSNLAIQSLYIDESKINILTRKIIKAFNNKKKILICGNGGSCADASHFAGELTCTFEKMNRRALPAIDLNSNFAALTAWSNDFDYNSFLERQIKALGRKNDILFLISTGGGSFKDKTSLNLIKAAKFAKKKKLQVFSLLGKSGGELKKLSNMSVVVKSYQTSHIQEAHIVILHIICKMIDAYYVK